MLLFDVYTVQVCFCHLQGARWYFSSVKVSFLVIVTNKKRSVTITTNLISDTPLTVLITSHFNHARF